MNDKQFMELKTTKEFDKFKFLDYNRPQEEARINKISELMLKYGFLVPVLVTKDFYIVDGQHRFSAAKKIGHEFSYLIIDIENNETLPLLISGMNSTQKQWKLYEYFDMWLKLGKEEYIKSYNLYTDLSLTQAEFLYISARGLSKNKKGNPIKDGSFKLTKNTENVTKKITERFSDIFSLNERFQVLSEHSSFRMSLIMAFQNTHYNHERMMKVLELESGMIPLKGSRIAYLKSIEEIYNIRLKEENKLDIAA